MAWMQALVDHLTAQPAQLLLAVHASLQLAPAVT
jgi:hypothetical protein